MKKYETFLNAFMQSWKNLDGEKTCNLFAQNCEYYENPIDPPCENLNQIKQLWALVPKNQRDISYSGSILFADEKSCIYHFVMTRTLTAIHMQQKIDGIFEIKLNDEGLLTYFKQWRFTKAI